MTSIDRARDLLEDRQRELRAELDQIDAALASLGSAGAETRYRRSSTRAPRGQRRQQVIGYLEQHRNSKPSQIAAALDMAPSQVSTLIRTLRKEKLVRKTRGGGYSLARKSGPSGGA